VKRIVADSSPLIVLARSGLIPVLNQVAGHVLAPAAVFPECTADAARPGAEAILQAREERLIELRADLEARWPDVAPPMLDAGELAALALAQNLGCPVLMDERLGRQVARLHGIPAIGSAGILLAAKARGLLPAVAAVLRTWREWGYFLAPELRNAVLARAGEGGSGRE
jgi:predicted nucleic acid-binding protein